MCMYVYYTVVLVPGDPLRSYRVKMCVYVYQTFVVVPKISVETLIICTYVCIYVRTYVCMYVYYTAELSPVDPVRS